MSHISLKVERKLGNKDKKNNLKAGVTKLCLRQGYQVLKRYVLLFLALIPYILPIIPQININISSIPQKAMIVFVVLCIILIYGRTLFTYSLLQTTFASTCRFLFHHPKRKENNLCIFCAGNWKCAKIISEEKQ